MSDAHEDCNCISDAFSGEDRLREAAERAIERTVDLSTPDKMKAWAKRASIALVVDYNTVKVDE